MHRIRIPCVLLAGAVPVAAQANTGVGYFTLSIPVAILALLPAIVLEGWILARRLAVPTGRGMRLATSANAWSTVAGIAAAIVADVSMQATAPFARGVLLSLVVPMFLFSWAIEHFVVARKEKGLARGAVARATLIANLASYAAIAAAIALWVPRVDPMQWRYIAVLPATQQARNEGLEVAEFFQSRGAFPPAATLTPSSRYTKSLRREADGRIVAELSVPEYPELDGKRIVVQPRMLGGRIERWICHSPDAPLRHMMPECRYRTPAEVP